MSIEVTREGRVALITINRPDVRNALSTEILRELDSELSDIARDDDVGAIVLTGAGDKAFIAGADIAELATKTPLEARAYGELGHEIADRLETMRKPTIAAVNGYALGGGCEVALACDIRLCSENAQFGQPEINARDHAGLGRHPAARAHDEHRLRQGDPPDRPHDLRRRGLPARPRAGRPPARGPDAARDGARGLDRDQEPALGRLRQGGDEPRADGELSASFSHEVDLFAILFSTEDAKEGLEAFIQKRKPRFVGR